MVWANNSGGRSVAYLNITVVDEIPTLSYSPSTLVLTINTESSDLPLNATLTGSGTYHLKAINATLPAGLNFGTSNGTIEGIPTVLQTTATTYTIWANNTGGSSSATITSRQRRGPGRSSITQRTTRGRTTPRSTLHRNSSTGQPETVQPGKLMTSLRLHYRRTATLVGS